MKNNKLIGILNDIGLSPNESQVYLASLSLGATTVLKIARSADMKRSTAYSIIESLKQKGLMKVEIKGLKSTFVAESPERLEIVLENRRNEFKNSLPEFLALYNLKDTESTIKYYEGYEAFKSVYMDTLREIKPHEEYLVITNQEKWYNLDQDFSLEYIEKRARLPIQIRMLIQDSPLSREHKKIERNYNEAIKILPEKTHLLVDSLILPRKVVITQLSPLSIIVIENQSVVQMQKTLFNIIWESLS